MYDRKQLDEPISSAVHFYHFSDEAENHLHQGLHQQIPQSSLRRGEGSSGGLDKGTRWAVSPVVFMFNGYASSY